MTHSPQTTALSPDAVTIIRVDGLSGPLTLLHVTDSHLSILDQAEAHYHRYSSRMDNAYREPDAGIFYTGGRKDHNRRNLNQPNKPMFSVFSFLQREKVRCSISACIPVNWEKGSDPWAGRRPNGDSLRDRGLREK